jgi:glycosyltransferase involved in cell wall biosynthesis/4-amino-4-deoxy-L-arabinose transferase-like glycosyltransferase
MTVGAFERRRTVLWILAGAAALRLAVFVVFRHVFDFELTGVIHGSAAYDTYARNLLSTGAYGLSPGVPDAVLPPLYGMLLAGVYRIFGRGALPVVLFNVVCDLVAIVALRRIGRRLFPRGAALGTIAGACLAFYPYLIFQSLTVVDTSLFVALLYGFLALTTDLGQVDRRHALRAGSTTGLVLGLGLLTRPVLLPLAALVPVWLAANVGVRVAAVRMIPVLLAAAAIIAPWTVRNWRALGQPVVFATNGGSNFWQGNNAATVPYLRAGYDVQWTPPPAIEAADRLGPAAEREFIRLTLDYLRAHPEIIPRLAWTKLRVLWSVDITPKINPAPDHRAGLTPGVVRAIDNGGGELVLGGLSPGDGVAEYSRPLFDRLGRAVHRVYWGALFVCGLIGIAITRRNWRDVSLVWTVPIALTVTYVVFHPSTRYRAPGDPAWFLFASAALVRALNGTSLAGRAVEEAAVAGCCWLGTSRYGQPLRPEVGKKWRALAALGRRLFVIGFSTSGVPRCFVQESTTFYLLPALPLAPLRHLTFFLLAPPLLLWVIGRHGVGTLIAQGPFEGSVGALIKTLGRLVGLRVALIVESHGDFERAPFLYRTLPFRFLYRKLMDVAARFALRKADALRAVSDATRNQLISYARGVPVVTFPAWIDVDTFARPAPASPPSESADLLFAGALVPARGLHVLLDAFAAMSPEVPAARLVIAGPAVNRPYAEALRVRLAEHRLQGRVRFAGEVSQADLVELMRCCRALVLPSLSEGLGRVALEAMLAGRPVVGTRAGGIPDIVRHGETGVLVEPGNAAALAAALIDVLKNVDVDSMGARAREDALRLVSTDVFVSGYLGLLRDAERHTLGG